MKQIEIPYEQDRSRRYRFFEIMPGAISWSLLLMPLLLSLINVTLAAFFILAYILIYFTRAMAVNVRALSGYRTMRHHARIDWNELLVEVESGEVSDHAKRPRWHHRNLARLKLKPSKVKPSELYHAIILATLNESRDVLEPTIEAIINSSYDNKRIIFFLAYEGRAGEDVEKRAKSLIAQFGRKFYYARAIKHPRIPDEVLGKGANITYAGRELAEYVKSQGIDPLKVIVTTLDSDNRPDKKYLSALSYLYCVADAAACI